MCGGKMRNNKQTSITIPEDLLKRLDERRGLIPRSTYIAELVRREVEGVKYVELSTSAPIKARE